MATLVHHHVLSVMLIPRDLCHKSKHYNHLFIYLFKYLNQIHLDQRTIRSLGKGGGQYFCAGVFFW